MISNRVNVHPSQRAWPDKLRAPGFLEKALTKPCMIFKQGQSLRERLWGGLRKGKKKMRAINNDKQRRKLGGSRITKGITRQWTAPTIFDV